MPQPRASETGRHCGSDRMSRQPHRPRALQDQRRPARPDGPRRGGRGGGQLRPTSVRHPPAIGDASARLCNRASAALQSPESGRVRGVGPRSSRRRSASTTWPAQSPSTDRDRVPSTPKSRNMDRPRDCTGSGAAGRSSPVIGSKSPIAASRQPFPNFASGRSTLADEHSTTSASKSVIGRSHRLSPPHFTPS